MTKPSAYLEALTEFSRLLRREGLTVDIQETMDAAAALEAIGFADREQVRAALRAIYAKSPQEQERLANIGNKTYQAAQLFIASVPMLLVYPFLQKYFTKGLVLGSVKG